MRRSLVLIAFCISCGNDSGPIAETENPENYHLVSGMVEDSVLHSSIAGVKIRIGDSLVVSDSQGRFATLHRSGNFGLTVDDYGYMAYEKSLAIFGNAQQVQVMLQGEAPYLISCTFEPDLVTARVVDLQGRKTINRRSQSTITLLSNETRFFREAYNWYWTPVDNYTWLAHVPHTGVAADTAVWRLEDADGYSRTAQCVNQPPACEGCAPGAR